MSRCNSSILWEFFQKIDSEKKATCNNCGEVYSYKTSTANLKTHLRRKHLAAYTRVSLTQSNARSQELSRGQQPTQPGDAQPGPSSSGSDVASSAPTATAPQVPGLAENLGGGPPTLEKGNPIDSRIMQLIETPDIGQVNSFGNESKVPIWIKATVSASGIEDPLHLPHESTGIRIDYIDSSHLENVFTGKELTEPIKESDAEMQDCEMQDKDWSDYTPQVLSIPLSAASTTSADTDYGRIKKRGWETLKIKSRIEKRRTKPKTSSLERFHLKKIEDLKFKKKIACEERDRAIETHKLDVAIKKETLKQAKIKTKILLLETKLKKKQLRRDTSDSD